MIELTRDVRFFLNGPDPRRMYDQPPERANGFSAWPAVRGLGRFCQLQVCCRGEVDPLTGYFMNIRQIDQAVREHVIPFLEAQLDSTRPSATLGMGQLLRRMIQLLQPPLGNTVHAITLDLSPFHRLSITSDAMSHVILRQQFEFAAAHRLHVPSLDADENRRIFGKCNHPSGHGHNYRLEVAVRAPIDPEGHILLVEQFDQRVDQRVIANLDHKHLNIDVPQFANLNPSCENIAKVVWDMLCDHLGDLNVTLAEITIWETGKTACTYRG